MIHHAIRKQQSDIWSVEHGIIQGDLLKLKARLAELYAEREEQHCEYVRSFEVLEALTKREHVPQPQDFLTWMGMDDYVQGRTILTQEYPPRS